MNLEVRPATDDDLAAITAISAASDTHWFGAPERSEAEMAEELDHADAVVLVLADTAPVAAAWAAGPHTGLTIDPAAAHREVVAALAPWLVERNGTLEVFSGDDPLRAALAAIGWAHTRSAFELIRPVEPSWVLEAPVWPAGVHITTLEGVDQRRVYELIYREAGWTDVEGHQDRDFEGWRSVFLTERDAPDQQVLAWRGDVPVGVSLGRIWDDGGGWVSQLAVARTERRNGLGKALLLESLRRRADAGATTLGLGVQAQNEGALALYLGAGLRIEREWQIFGPAAQA